MLIEYNIWNILSVKIGKEISYLIDFKSSSHVLTKSHFESFYLSANFGYVFNVLNGIDIGTRYNRGLTPFSKAEIADEHGQPFGKDHKE